MVHVSRMRVVFILFDNTFWSIHKKFCTSVSEMYINHFQNKQSHIQFIYIQEAEWKKHTTPF